MKAPTMSQILGKFNPLEKNGPIILIVGSLALLAVRVWLAMPFWYSGWTKWASFPTKIGTGAKYLFQHEYKLHLGFTTLDMPLIIQLTYPGAYLIHGSWAIAALVLVYAGPGLISTDYGIRRVLK